jgi:hypothetical protein
MEEPMPGEATKQEVQATPEESVIVLTLLRPPKRSSTGYYFTSPLSD